MLNYGLESAIRLADERRVFFIASLQGPASFKMCTVTFLGIKLYLLVSQSLSCSKLRICESLHPYFQFNTMVHIFILELAQVPGVARGMFCVKITLFFVFTLSTLATTAGLSICNHTSICFLGMKNTYPKFCPDPSEKCIILPQTRPLPSFFANGLVFEIK